MLLLAGLQSIFLKKLVIVLAISISIFLEDIFAQSSHQIFEHLSTDHGLSSNKVESVIQDRDGFYWIATQNGLNRFDGSNFKVFVHNKDDSTSLTHNYCTALNEALCSLTLSLLSLLSLLSHSLAPSL